MAKNTTAKAAPVAAAPAKDKKAATAPVKGAKAKAALESAVAKTPPTEKVITRKEKPADGSSVHAALPTREPKWNARRKALVMAMRALGATSATSAVLAEDIAKKMGTVEGVKMTDRVDFVKIILDVYRTAELLHNGFAASVKHDGERALRYYLTKKGQTTKFPAAE